MGHSATQAHSVKIVKLFQTVPHSVLILNDTRFLVEPES